MVGLTDIGLTFDLGEWVDSDGFVNLGVVLGKIFIDFLVNC